MRRTTALMSSLLAAVASEHVGTDTQYEVPIDVLKKSPVVESVLQNAQKAMRAQEARRTTRSADPSAPATGASAPNPPSTPSPSS